MRQAPLHTGRGSLVRRPNTIIVLLCATALGAVIGRVGLVGFPDGADESRIAVDGGPSPRSPESQPTAVGSPEGYHWTLDPNLSLRPEALAFSRNAPLQTAFRSASAKPPSSPGPVVASVRVESAPPVQPNSPPQVLASAVPLPVPRPSEFRTANSLEMTRPSRNPTIRKSGNAALRTEQADSRSFLERFFGVQSPPKAASSYAALGTVGTAPSGGLGPGRGSAGAGAAIYDISAQIVYMPNGERLEAHSGLGDKLDDPDYVHVRMHGATPPGTYDLTEREQLFHGVRALRLNPVGGSGAVYGRAGLLAHTFMLGPNGDSNGCVSFRDYNKFLQAFLRGEVQRLVVVTGRGRDVVPTLAGRASPAQRFAQSARNT
jgi:hypothetical protein